MTSSTSEYNQSAKKEQPKFDNLWEYPLFLKDENGRLKKRVQLLEAAMALTQGARVHMLEFFPGAAGVDLSTLHGLGFSSRKRGLTIRGRYGLDAGGEGPYASVFFPGLYSRVWTLSTLLSRKRPHVPQPAGGGPSV